MNLSRASATRIDFLNSLAFGVITPPVYYMIALPFSNWIALLFVVDILGRLTGQRLANYLRIPLAITQILNALAYSILIVVGLIRPTPSTGFALIYLSQIIIATASANLPSVRPTNPDRGFLPAQIGFAIGCALTAILASHHPVPDSILVTGGLMIPAVAATALSLLSAVIAWSTQTRSSNEFSSADADSEVFQRAGSPTGSPLQLDYPSISDSEFAPNPIRLICGIIALLACESAFAMILCVAPLTDREILAFSPATLGCFFATFALISAAVAWWTGRQQRLLPFALSLGMFLSAVGFFGFSYALWLSWKYAETDGIPRAMRAMWTAGVPVAIGHGLLRASLPWARRKVAGSLNLAIVDGALALVAVISVIFVSHIWAPHERASLAIPGALLLITLPLAAALLVLNGNKKLKSPAHAFS